MKRTGQGLSCQVLPGPKNNSGPIRYLERERERESGLQEDFAELGDKNACSRGNTVVVVFPVSHILWPLITRTHAKKKRICKDIIKADRKDFLFDFDFRELGLHALTTSYFYPLCCFFSDGAMLRSYGEIMLRLFVTGFFFFSSSFFFLASRFHSLSLSLP